MRLYKRGNVWWFELDFNRRQIRKSTKTRNRVTAGQVASAYHTALIKGDVGIVERKPVPTFDQAMAEFLAWSQREHHDHPQTTKRYRTSSVPLLKYFKRSPLDQITAAAAEQYKTDRSAEHGKRTRRKLRPATVNRELACMRAMFNHAIKAHSELRNPISKATGVRLLGEDNEQDRVLKYSEQRAYMETASPMLRDVAGLILETGMRPEEVYTLRDTAVNLDEGWLRIIRGKTPAARRRIDLTPEAHRILSERLAAIGVGYLFPHDTDPSRPVPKVNNAHDRALEASKVPKFRLYDLRHTWATRAAESGIDLVTLAAMMGHSRIQMVMRYAHPTQGHQSSAMQKLAQHNAAAEAREKAAARLAEERKNGGQKLAIMRKPA